LLARAGAWLGVYILLCLAPMLLLSAGRMPPGRALATEFGVALGMVGFGMLVAQCLTTARHRWVAPGVGSDNELMFHRRAGLLAFVVVVGHLAVLIAAEPKNLEYFDPRANALRAVFLSAATAGLVLLVALPMWRLTHGLITAGVLLVAVAHAIQVGHYASAAWKQAGWAAIGGAGMLLVAYARLAKSLRVADANDTWDEVAFREELDELKAALNLAVVHVLRDPPPGWAGEAGYVTAELIGRYLPAWAVNRYHCYACGPAPLMDAASAGFAARGVPLWRQASERFQVV
jgi:predicted ferric reductase